MSKKVCKTDIFLSFWSFLRLGVPPIFISKFVCRKLKKVENHCSKGWKIRVFSKLTRSSMFVFLSAITPFNPRHTEFFFLLLLILSDFYLLVSIRGFIACMEICGKKDQIFFFISQQIISCIFDTLIRSNTKTFSKQIFLERFLWQLVNFG